MQNLEQLSDPELVKQLNQLVLEERKLTSQVLLHLKELEKRKLFLQLGYPSLFEYSVKVLGYSESGAFRRISAMRLMKQMPEVKEALDQGRLTLSKLTQAQAFFKREEKEGKPVNVEIRREILSGLEGKSSRECEKIFAELAPSPIPEDKERVLGGGNTEIRFVASDRLLKKLKNFKDLHSHTLHDASYAQIFETLVDLALKEKKARETEISSVPSTSKVSSSNEGLSPKSTRYIPAQMKRDIWTRDSGACVFKNKQTGKVCGSTFQVQLDHILPLAKGGETSTENLRLLCRGHNLWAASQYFGENHMRKFRKEWGARSTAH